MDIKTISVSYQRKFNLGDYESVEIGCALWGQIDPEEDAEGATQFLFNPFDQQLLAFRETCEQVYADVQNKPHEAKTLLWHSMWVFCPELKTEKRERGGQASNACVCTGFEKPSFDSVVINNSFPGLICVPWLCAMKDFNWGYHTINSHGGYKLTDLALWMGIGISAVHRAADDVRLLVECLNRHKDLPKLVDDAIALSQSPMVEIKALVSYEERHKASKAKFIWDGDRRIWHKSVRECLLDDFLRTLDFDVSVVEKSS